MPTFDWIPRAWEEQVQYSNLVTVFENGKEQRREKGPPRRRFVLNFTREETDADEIFDFYRARRGRFEPFDFIHPLTAEVIPVRFDTDLFSRENARALIYDFGLPLIEVL